MGSDPVECQELFNRAERGDPEALGELFQRHRDRLRRMVQLRIHNRLQGRLDPSDVLQEAYLEFSRSLKDYLRNPEVPFFLWLRFITGRKLQALHRHHLGTKIGCRSGDFAAPWSSAAGELADAGGPASGTVYQPK